MKFITDIFLTNFAKALGDTPTRSQKQGLTFLLRKIENDPRWPADLRFIAYFLATIWHETNGKFQPVKEVRERLSSPRRANQDRYWLTGEYGRGYVQITWDKNYQKFGLTPETRDKALEPDTAYEIAARGMLEGLFTGRKLGNFFKPGLTNWLDARTIINGHDRAAQIANKAIKMQACLSLALETPPKPISPQPQPENKPDSPRFSGKAIEIVQSVRKGYAGTSTSEKSLISRVLQVVWAGVLGALAFIQTHPIHTAIVVLVLLLGFLALYKYANRQDRKTFLGLQ